jgi:hypothetical protein
MRSGRQIAIEASLTSGDSALGQPYLRHPADGGWYNEDPKRLMPKR